MTGEKNRYTTFEKQNRLDDEYLTSPEHDALVLELLNPDNHLPFLKCVRLDSKRYIDYGKPAERAINIEYLSEEQKKKVYSDAQLSLSSKIDTYVKKECSFSQLLAVETEVPIVNTYNNFIIGYLDVSFKVPFRVQKVIYSDEIKEKSNREKRTFEVDGFEQTEEVEASLSMKNTIEIYNKSFPHLYPHLDMLFNGRNGVMYKRINVEVKPKIDSFGKTMRQLNTYRHHFTANIREHGEELKTVRTAQLVVYSPDTRFKNDFEAQGIKFVSPEDIREMK